MLITKLDYKKIPDNSGVYFFQKGSKILYIGKATSLKDRIRSYFGSDLVIRRGLKITSMIENATVINWQETDSVLEALMLEVNLIKKHQPPANTLGKDNKSYNHVVITQEDFPRVILIREHDLKFRENLGFEIKYQFGPFPHGGQLKEALRIIRKIFPFRGEKDFVNKNKKNRSNLNVELGLSPDFSIISKKEYQKTIRNLKLFFEGKKKSLKKKLEAEMKKLAQKQEFEKAQNIRNQIFSLDHIQDIAILKNENKSSLNRIEAYDIAHLSETNRVGVMVVIEKGILKKQAYRKFNIRLKGGGDVGALGEVLERRLKREEWSFPDLMVVDGGKAQLKLAQQKLSEFNLEIPIVAVTKDEHHKARSFLGNSEIISKNERDILLANSEAHRFAIKFHREKRGKFFK